MDKKHLIKLISFLFIFMISKEAFGSLNFYNFKFSTPGDGLIKMETVGVKQWIFVVFSPESKEVQGNMIVLKILPRECFLTDGIWGKDISGHLNTPNMLEGPDKLIQWWIKLEGNNKVTFGKGTTPGQNQIGVLNVTSSQNLSKRMINCAIVIGNEKGQLKSITVHNLK